MTQVGTGIDRNTGRLLSGWDHVVQSILTIMTTAYGERGLIQIAIRSNTDLLRESLVSCHSCRSIPLRRE